MSDPVSAAIAMGLIGYGTVSSAIAQNQAGKDEEKYRKAEAALIEAEGETEARAYGEQAGLTREEKARLAARRNVLQSKAGLLAGVGSHGIVTKDSLARIEAQAQALQDKDWYTRQYSLYAAKIQRAAGKAARRAGKLTSLGTLATGFGSMALMGLPKLFGGGGRYNLMNPKTGYTGTIKQSQINTWLAKP